MKLRAVTLVLVGVLLVGGTGYWGVAWWDERRHFEITDNAYIRGSITMIASRISGYVETVPPPTHTHVLPGDVLAVFNDEPFRALADAAGARAGEADAAVSVAVAEVEVAGAEVEAARASLASATARRSHAEARLVLQQTTIESAEARAASARSERDHAAQEFERADALLEGRSISRQRHDAARARLVKAEHDARAAQSDVEQARHDLAVIDAELTGITADIGERAAAVQRAEARRLAVLADLEARRASLEAAQADHQAALIDLESTRVVAPVEGFIANQTVEPGFYIEEGWPMMAVVPLHNVWVTANFKETQIERLRVGQDVRLEVDAFPGRPIDGNILSLAPASAASFSLLPPQNASGNFVKVVQRVPVKIRFQAPQDLANRLVPGMSVVVKVDTRSVPDGPTLARRVP